MRPWAVSFDILAASGKGEFMSIKEKIALTKLTSKGG